jgi:hypothetical protein
MNHGINNTILYTACKIISKVSNGDETCQLRGTGFFTMNKCEMVFFITNRHMIDCNYRKETSYKLLSMQIYNKNHNKNTNLPSNLTIYDVGNLADVIFSPIFENDIACLPIIPKYLSIVSKDEGSDGKIAFHIPYSYYATDDEFQKLSICDFVAYPGFPDWYDNRNNNPILRVGTISSDPRFDYSVTDDYMGSVVAYEGFSYGGSSGSPIFALQKNFQVGGAIEAPTDFYRRTMLIGLNAGHFNDTFGNNNHSGISYFYKIKDVLDIIDKYSS